MDTTNKPGYLFALSPDPARRALPAEPPSPMVSIGRGIMDLIQPAIQGYYNVWGTPQEAATYRARRAEAKDLYKRGVLARDPSGYDYGHGHRGESAAAGSST